MNSTSLNRLARQLRGTLEWDELHKIAYATDASPYREIPLAVACPASLEDIRSLIDFAREQHITLIPRAGGTSLAGQVTGSGLVVDVSRHMNQILEINPQEQWARVEPGVILDDLNQVARAHGLFFGPETSTSNRCCLGGMVGNNSCGAHSLVYGSTRDHIRWLKVMLSDGSEATLCDWNTLTGVAQPGSLLENICNNLSAILSDTENQQEIRRQYPRPDIHRRNNGYALDALLETEPFSGNHIPFNLSRLIAGSEGTLAFVTEICVGLVPLPPPFKALVCVHLNSVDEALQANLIALRHHPAAVELMDDVILKCTRENLSQQRNRFFVQGDPGAILIIEFAGSDAENTLPVANQVIAALRDAGYGYHFPIITGSDINRVWALRKAGLGVLSNIKGDAKPVSVTEDTAVHPEDLPGFIRDFRALLDRHSLTAVYHAHIATGELHLRPVLNLKDPSDRETFRTLARETAMLVKKYRGSLSGEHGDGRLRGEFIPLMYGERVYRLFCQIKDLFDPNHLFNAGKIVHTPPMNSFLRYESGQDTRQWKTWFRFSETQGLMRAVEACNGSGDCRKPVSMGGLMCPSYMATREEQHTTRARANILREYLTRSAKPNPFDQQEIHRVMDLCLSCKGCKSECPSNVDMAMIKAEFLQQYYRSNGVPIRSWLFARNHLFQKAGTIFPAGYNLLMRLTLFKKLIGCAPERSLPTLSPRHFRAIWNHRRLEALNHKLSRVKGQLYLFVDEFSEYNEAWIAETALQLLHRLGYQILLPPHTESGRAAISKGLLSRARNLAERNVASLYPLVSDDCPLVGLEPSCILGFRDEYPQLVRPEWTQCAEQLATNTFTLEEFVVREWEQGRISSHSFTDKPAKVRFHGHCHQKALTTTTFLHRMLSIPVNYKVQEIKSGCCGMAGSFGYEKEHYDLSMKVGELVLFPEVRDMDAEEILVAPGTSCRQHIQHGTGRMAIHPAEMLFRALKD